MRCLKAITVAAALVFSSVAFGNDIENGPDFGFTPDEYAERFNGHLEQMGLPLALDPTIEDEDVGAQAVFSTVFADVVAFTGSAKPESRLVNGFTVTGVGNGTEESGQVILLIFATTIASVDPAGTPDEHLSTVLDLLQEMSADPDASASTVIDGVTYNVTQIPQMGVMLGISPSA